MLNIAVHTTSVSDASPDTLFEIIGDGRQPLVFKGLIRDWPLVQRGLESDESLIDYLLSHYSGRPVVFYQAAPDKKGRFAYTHDGKSLDFASQKGSLATVLEHLVHSKAQPDPDTYYVGSTTVDVCLPGLREHNDLPLSHLRPLVSIWIGNRSRVPAHFDSPDNLACCVAGKRSFTLFPPDQLENLYIGPLHHTPSGQAISLVDFGSPDYSRFPRFAEALAHAQVAHLDPGDVLFLPSMWWHHVESFCDINVLINYWWRQDKPFMDAPLDALSHAMLSIRDLPQKEKDAWRKIFAHYVFDEQTDKYSHIPEEARGFLDPLDDISARKLRAWLMNRLNK